MSQPRDQEQAGPSRVNITNASQRRWTYQDHLDAESQTRDDPELTLEEALKGLESYDSCLAEANKLIKFNQEKLEVFTEELQKTEEELTSQSRSRHRTRLLLRKKNHLRIVIEGCLDHLLSLRTAKTITEPW